MAAASSGPVLLLIPGLGSDHRLWHLLRDLPFETIAPDYIEAHKSETLEGYSRRFLAHLFDRELLPRNREIVLVGASMGGAIAQEMTRHCDAKALVLSGSLRSNRELRPIVRRFGASIACRLPIWVYQAATIFVPFVMRYLSAIPASEVQLCTHMYVHLSKRFFRDGYKMLADWRGCEVTLPTFRVHGKRDHIIPFVRIDHADVAVADAKHLLCLSHPEILRQAITAFVSEVIERS